MGKAPRPPVAAGEGAIVLMARLWPAFQDIDTSSGALGSAVNTALAEIVPILIAAPATPKVRAGWLERLYDAVQEDGVQYLYPVEQRWGEIAVYPELMNAYADLLLPLLRRAWCTGPADHDVHITGHTICLSCLLEAGDYEELLDLLTNARNRFWSDQRFGAEALTRQGHYDAALAFADSCGRASIQSYDHRQIDRFCEGVLLEAGREEEAYRKYGPHVGAGATNVAIYRDTLRRYPRREPRRVLLDLIEARGAKGKWFAAAKSAGLLDIALDCAGSTDAEPATLVRAARDFAGKNAEFSTQVALLALSGLLNGAGYDPDPANVHAAYDNLMAGAVRLGAEAWARDQVATLASGPCAPGREHMQQSLVHLLERGGHPSPNGTNGTGHKPGR